MGTRKQSQANRITVLISIVSYSASLSEITSAVASIMKAISVLTRAGQQEYEFKISVIENGENQDLDDKLPNIPMGHNVELSCLHGHGNIGYGAALNLSLRKPNVDFHFVMNADVIIQPNSLKAGIDYLRKNENVALVSPAAVNQAGIKQHLCKQYPSITTLFLRGFMPELGKKLLPKKMARYEMQELPPTEPNTEISIISGCCILGKGEAFRAVNGFDEGYFLYFEDFDLSLRMRPIGLLAYLPSMQIMHKGGNASRKGFKHKLYFVKSALRFFNTHGWKWF